MSFPPCQGCEECQTTLETSPTLHQKLATHEWVTKYNENTGEPYQMCSKCFTKKDAETK